MIKKNLFSITNMNMIRSEILRDRAFCNINISYRVILLSRFYIEFFFSMKTWSLLV